MSFATVDPHAPPQLAFPRQYNAAVDLVDRHILDGNGARIAYRDDTSSITYAGLAERINRAGNALLALGVRREERVLLSLLDTIDFPVVFLAAMKIGAVPVPVNTLLQPADYAYLATDSRARVLVVSDHLLPKWEHAGALVIVTAATPLGGERGAYARLETLLADAAPTLVAGAVTTTPDDVAFWLYSSGSTGAPKAAVHLHSHLMWSSALYAQGVLGIAPDDVVYSAAKLFFAYGLGNALTFPLSVGASAVLTAERVTPSVVARIMNAHRPTIFCGVPTLFVSVLNDESIDALPSLRVSTSAGEALPRHVGERWQARFGTPILDGIGSTEMLHIFLSNRVGEIRYGTTGRAVPGYALELRDDADGALVADGDEGSLWVKGPTACVAYWNQRAKSLATFVGEWTRTGDRYIRDHDGYYTYSGRADDMLKVGGIWVSPFEVESALATHPAVLECAVVGHPDEAGLIKPKAFVVLKVQERLNVATLIVELQTHVKAVLAPYKYPRTIEFVGELPKTATGKIQRFRLRTT